MALVKMRSFVLYVFFAGCLQISPSITETVSAKYVNNNRDIRKRETNLKDSNNSTNDFFPDWVPFDNKNIEELGEFVRSKPKPKKRLAPPINYVLKSAVDTNLDDYYDRPLEGDDASLKSEWPAAEVLPENNALVTENEKIPTINITTTTTTTTTSTENTTPIETTVETVTKEPRTRLIPKRSSRIKDNKVLRKNKGKRTYDEEFDLREEEVVKNKNDKSHQENQNDEPIKKDSNEDYETEEAVPKPNEEAKNAKKIQQLNEVDDLKRRHEAEQRQISERAREEEYQIEQRERDLVLFKVKRKQNDFRDWGALGANNDNDDTEKVTKKPYRNENSKRVTVRPLYGSKTSPKLLNYLKERTNDTSSRRPFTKSSKIDPDYPEDDENVNRYKKRPNLSPRKSASGLTKQKNKNDKQRTKQKYIYSTTSTTPLPTQTQYKTKTERIVANPESKRTELRNRETNTNKTRKMKRRRKPKTTTFAPDSFVAESVEDTASTKATTTTTTLDATRDAVSTNSDPVSDVVPAASDHKKDEGGDHSYKRGGGKDHHSEEESEHAEHGKKAYEGKHEEHKKTVGHHDKEEHDGHYDDSGGHDRKHHDESEHYGGHHHEEHGKKHAKYEESGKHSKGHSTKGSHDIHKKEEYEKKVEFFEEEGDSGDEEKHGGYNSEKEHASGGHYKKANLEAGHKGGEKGHSGHHEKGGHALGYKEHRLAGGHDAHGKHGHESHGQGGHAGGKKWVYHHGHPAKTANLVAIDRRSNQAPVHFVPYY